ncbi:TIM barrel protein [Nonomuraea soli]|uniref:Inosose dehydratase n=1 Tax=Nonomuraea soli TaxID=1032476 RepID=A0A7W0CR14_9ACTN|nr:TIM barrel protein [Nonomuraea soli]MBA2895695.1 inosose dehydratase [Nonomuraea soli]
MKIAGAPISWGVCEVPGWGHQLPPARVLAEMRELGLAATELGPSGYLTQEFLTRYGMSGIAQFVPVVLHDPEHDPIPEILAADVEVVVLAASTGHDGYDTRPVLDETGWRTLLGNLDRAAALDRLVTLHPHVGTMIENRYEVERVLDDSVIPLCLDTGHLLIGGTDPLSVVRRDPARIAHVHLKDVDAALAAKVPEIGYTRAVREGVYRPLGRGDVDVAGIVAALDKDGYSGWYVMEQDVVLSGPDDDPMDDVKQSLAYLKGIGRD